MVMKLCFTLFNNSNNAKRHFVSKKASCTANELINKDIYYYVVVIFDYIVKQFVKHNFITTNPYFYSVFGELSLVA